MVLQTCELVAEIQFTAKEEDSDPVICRVAEPSGSRFHAWILLLNPSLTALEPERSGDSRRQIRYN